MEALIKNLKSFGKIELNTIIISVFLGLLVLSNLIIGNYFIIYIGALILSFIFIWQSPQAGFLSAILVTIIFGQHFSLLPIQINETIYKIYALDFVLIFTFIAWFLKEPTKKIDFKKIFTNKKNLWLLIFFAFIFLNLIISIIFKNPNISLAIGTFKNYAYLLVYFLVIALFKNKDDIYLIIKTLFWGGILLLGFVFYGWITGIGLWSEITPGTRYLSGLHSYYLTFSIIILLISLIYKKYIFNFFSALIIFLLQVLGMIGGMFRHLWLGLATTFIAIFNFLSFKGKMKFIHIGLVVLLIILLTGLIFLWLSGILLGNEYGFSQTNFFSSILNRGQTLFEIRNNVESATGWRLATWEIALDKFLSNPLLGIGLGQRFYFEYRGFVDLIDIRNIHNDFASLLVQLGLLGFIPFILFNFYSIKDILKSKKSEMHLILIGFWIISIFGIFFAIYLMFNGTSIFYWTIMGLMAILHKKNNEYIVN